MNKIHKLFFISIFLISHFASSSEILKFSTLEWPPYLGENLPKQGFGIEILKKAFKAEGYSHIQTHFLPWSRALLVAENDKDYVGCLLAYYSKERAKKFIYSDPVISGSIKFSMRKEKIIKWNKLEDLKDKNIGVVQDYVNSPELDSLIANKKLYVDYTISDENNLVKLALKRIDLAVIDSNVFIYLIKTHPNLIPYKNKLVLGEAILEEKKIYVLFSNNKKGKQLVKIFNKGLKKINPTEIAKKYLAEI